jgi:hypothetical protein
MIQSEGDAPSTSKGKVFQYMLFLGPKTPRLEDDIEVADDPQSEQNTQIPSTELAINPKIQAILDDLDTDLDNVEFLNILQTGVNRWTEILNLVCLFASVNSLLFNDFRYITARGCVLAQFAKCTREHQAAMRFKNNL